MNRLSVYGRCNLTVATPHLLRSDRPLNVFTDPHAGIIAVPCGSKNGGARDYDTGGVPLSLTCIRVSQGARVTIADAGAISPQELTCQVTSDAHLIWTATTWIDSLTVCGGLSGRIDARRCVMTQTLNVAGDNSLVVDNIIVQESVSVAPEIVSLHAVRVHCTAFTRLSATHNAVIQVTSLLPRVVPRVPTTLYAGPCQFCLEATGELYAGCGHLFVCQPCLEEHGSQRILHAPCPLCRSVVTSLCKTWTPLRCQS